VAQLKLLPKQPHALDRRDLRQLKKSVLGTTRGFLQSDVPAIDLEPLLRLLLVGYIGEFDAGVERKRVNILAGGALCAPQTVGEQYVPDLERESFLSLCAERKTAERIPHPLKTGKPRRN
jgi:hypothetical protein